MVPNVASSNLVTRPIKFKNARLGIFKFNRDRMSRIRTGQFDKIAGENEQGKVRTVAIWKGAHERSEVGIYNLVTRHIKSTNSSIVAIFIANQV